MMRSRFWRCPAYIAHCPRVERFTRACASAMSAQSGAPEERFIAASFTKCIGERVVAGDHRVAVIGARFPADSAVGLLDEFVFDRGAQRNFRDGRPLAASL